MIKLSVMLFLLGITMIGSGLFTLYIGSFFSDRVVVFLAFLSELVGDAWNGAVSLTRKLIWFVFACAIVTTMWQFYTFIDGGAVLFGFFSYLTSFFHYQTYVEVFESEAVVEDFGLACNEIMVFLSQQGFLSPGQRIAYCDHGCKGLNLDCSQPSVGDNWVTKVVRGDFDTYITDTVGDVSVDEHIVLAWYQIVWQCSPVLCCIVPIFANKMQYFDLKGGTLLILGYGTFAWFGGMSGAMAFYNIVICVTCLAYPAGASGMIEALSAWIVFVCVLCSTFFVSPFMQVMVVIGSIILYSAYLGTMFMSKRKNIEPAVIIMIVQILIMVEQLSYVRENFLLSNYSTVIIEMGLNSIYPSGYSSYYLENSMRLTRAALIKMPVADIYIEKAFVVYMVVQIFCFGVFRSGLGAFYVSSKRYNIDGKVMFEGLTTYFSDLFGPALMIFKMLTGRERVRGKRIAYGVVSLSLSWFEMRYAYEIFIIRFGASLLNLVWCGGNFSGAPNALAINVDMNFAPYPQMNSRPWVSLVKLGEMADDGLVNIINTRKDGTKSKGVGLVVRNQKKKKLITVKHVIADSEHIQIDSGDGKLVQVANCDFKGHSGCGDPVVSSAVGFDCNPPDLDIVTVGEIGLIKDLFFISKDDYGESMLNACGNFTIDLNANTVNAAIDLKHGDSGGPVIGFLKDGTPRLVGAVSKGNPSQLGGNIISLACSTAVHTYDSESDESVGTRLSAQWFNSVRNPKRMRSDTAKEFKRVIDIVAQLDSEDRIDKEVDRIIVENSNKKVAFVDQGRKDTDNWEDWAEDDDVRNRGKERSGQTKSQVKSQRKNRAFRKRHVIDEACGYCKILYGDEARDMLKPYLDGGFDFRLGDDQVLGFINENFKVVPIDFFGVPNSD